MDDAEVPVETAGPDRSKLKRARQVLDSTYEQARAGDYEQDTSAMRVLGRAELNYQRVRQDGVHDGPPGEPSEREADRCDIAADVRAGLSLRRDRDADVRDGLADLRDDRLREGITTADERDHDAEQRDRMAARRDAAAEARAQDSDGAAQADRAASATDRFHAGRDRDAAAVDRATSTNSADLSAQSRRQASDDRVDASVSGCLPRWTATMLATTERQTASAARSGSPWRCPQSADVLRPARAERGHQLPPAMWGERGRRDVVPGALVQREGPFPAACTSS